MKKIIIISFLSLLCAPAFSQADTTAIFHIADSLNTLGDKLYDKEKYIEALVLYTQASEMQVCPNELFRLKTGRRERGLAFRRIFGD